MRSPSALRAIIFSLVLNLSAFAPALAGEEPRNFDKAALRAEAEAMLLPDPSLNLKSAPNVWKVFGSDFTPTGTIPSYYGTPIPADTPDGCYTSDVFFKDIPTYTLNQLAEFDPSTVPCFSAASTNSAAWRPWPIPRVSAWSARPCTMAACAL